MASGVANAVADGVIPRAAVDELALIAAVWVDPARRSTRRPSTATRAALAAGHTDEPALERVLEARAAPRNPFFTPRS